jgi:glycosyltransferase involved in cell wall biosynthesis
VRIVYLNPCGNFGGAETSLRELLASVRAAEPAWQLTLVLGEDGPLGGVARDLGVRVIVKPFPRELARIGDTTGSRFAGIWSLLWAAGKTARYGWRLAGLIREIHPDIIHTNGLKMHLLGVLVRPRHTPLVWHIHDYVSKRRFTGRLLRLFRKACTLAIANSRSVASDLQVLLPGLRVTTIYNAVDLARFTPNGKRLDLDALSGLPPASPEIVRVGLVATFARWKGHKVFLEALGQAASQVPVRGYIVGDAIYQTNGSQWSRLELEETVARLGLARNLGFTGFVADTAAVMRSLDIVVHASTDPEPFGMVIVEAMACGKAVIVSQAGGASELFTDGEDALGHPPGDAAALARQITRLACDESLRRRLGQAGRARAARIHDGKRLARELLTLYRDIAGVRVPAEGEIVLQSSLSSVDE